MEITAVLLVIGLGAVLWAQSRRAKKNAADVKRHADALEQQVGALQKQIAGMRDAESQRQLDAASRKRLFEERKRLQEQNDVSDIDNQIRFISQTELRAVRPVNKEAVRVLYALDEWIAAHRPDWRVAFEVGMGAFIKTSYDPNDRTQSAAFSSYNSKRVDFLLIDRFGLPMLAVEYHGTGHDLSDDASRRMAVKRLALERAGVPLVEVPANAPKPAILRMVNERLAAQTAVAN